MTKNTMILKKRVLGPKSLDRAFQIIYLLIILPLDISLCKLLTNLVTLPAVACHFALLYVQNIFTAADTHSGTTGMQGSSQAICSAEC
jgi:hypothetical protein